MSKINNDRLGNLTRDDINFPEHLTPEIVHTALYIHNADSKEEVVKRSEYMAKQLGNKAMTYVMALLVLPYLIEKTQDTTDYKDFIASKKKTIN
jgi:hypothetical protein|tara:strand:+ start:286 stop:567 length:282 start_codon:yes stop_codon:yes gene_type:complete